MIYLHLAIGAAHGWGMCGRYITHEIAKLEPVRLIAEPSDLAAVCDPLEFYELRKLLLGEHAVAEFPRDEGVSRADGPMLQGIGDERLLPRRQSRVRGRVTIGYTFFEHNLMQPAWIENGRRFFTRIATGSSWCTSVLKAAGLADVQTVIQGIDPAIFHPASSDRFGHEFFPDKFVVFSGGKFEFRKGQDVVIRAYKALQERHPDVMLVYAWLNPWTQFIETMRESRLIRFRPPREPDAYVMGHVLADNGIDLERVMSVPRLPNSMMSRIYHNTDVGLFPNRCEGGTNLVLMEYMACGKPVIAVNTTGHADIVNDANALVMQTAGEVTVHGQDNNAIAVWPEPDVQDAIDKLEWAYQNRDQMCRYGAQAGLDLGQRTWHRTAMAFQELIHRTDDSGGEDGQGRTEATEAVVTCHRANAAPSAREEGSAVAADCRL